MPVEVAQLKMNGSHIPHARLRARIPSASLLVAVLHDKRLFMPVILWVMLYVNINSGPWFLRSMPQSPMAAFHTLRAAFPIVILLLAPFVVQQSGPRNSLPKPLVLWGFYCLVAAVAGLVGPNPASAWYWAVAYLATLAAVSVWLRSGWPIARSLQLNHLTWFLTTVVLAVLVVVARDALLVVTPSGDISGYGLVNRVGPVGGMAMSRSSGMARFASVPGVIAYVMLWSDRQSLRRVFWGLLLFGSAALIYFMQSRGAIVGLAFALLVVTWFLGPRVRRFVLALLALCVMATVLEAVSPDFTQKVYTHLTRAQSAEDLTSMTGRTKTWAEAIPLIEKSPLWGWGFEAGRAFGLEHLHNTYFYALMSAGLLGTVPFVWGLVLAWHSVYRIERSGVANRLGHRVGFVQAVGILAFFTVRGIPEVCGASYAVDLVVMVPAIAYLSLLDTASRVSQMPPRLRSDRRIHRVPILH